MPFRVADLIVSCLQLHGVDRAYSVPGESFLPVLDALYEQEKIDLVTCRHEGSAGLAAVADAKLTGKPGVFFVSRGPGAFNGGIALHVAEQEAIPLVMFIGQVDTPNLGRGAVQEIDASQTFAGTLKWTGRIDNAEIAAEVVARAFAIASSGTPGPVVVELPEDVLSQPAAEGTARVHGVARPSCSPDDAAECATLMSLAQRPVLLVGSECRTDEFRADLLKLSELWNLPVIASNKCQDQFPNEHSNWVGQMGFFPNPAQVELFKQVDLIVALGTRLGDVSSLGFAFPKQDGSQRLIHVYPDADKIGQQFAPSIAVVSSAHSFVQSMLQQISEKRFGDAWLARTRQTREATSHWNPERVPAEDVFGHAVTALAHHLAEDAVVTTDSGNFAGWVHRVFRMQGKNRLLGSACGAMGSGVPSGLSAALRYPGRQVLAFCGDGGFLMNGNELATAVERGLNLKIIVSNNRSYGTIRTHQQRAYPSRVSGTDLTNPDFARLAEAYGARGFLIDKAGDAGSVVEKAMRTPGPVLIEVRSHADQGVEKSAAAMRAAS